jgi:hypothetical protein
MTIGTMPKGLITLCKMTLSIRTLSSITHDALNITLSITTLGVMAFLIMILSMTTHSIITVSIGTFGIDYN